MMGAKELELLLSKREVTHALTDHVKDRVRIDAEVMFFYLEKQARLYPQRTIFMNVCNRNVLVPSPELS